jgi:hypothetical protein
MLLTKSDFLAYGNAPLHAWAKAHHLITAPTPAAYELHQQQQGYQIESWLKLG